MAIEIKNKYHNQDVRLPLDTNQNNYGVHEQLEIAKCASDVIYFAENYFYIITPSGRRLIKLYKKQKDMLLGFVENNKNIVLASRQIGKSTVMGIFTLWFLLFNEDKSVLYAANKLDTAKELFERIQMAYKELPNFIKPGAAVWNKMQLVLGNNSKIQVTTTSGQSGRGGSHHLVLLDEFAFVKPEVADEFYNSVMPTISSGLIDKDSPSKIIIVSTANGNQNLFYKLYFNATENAKLFDPDPTAWTPYKIMWDEMPREDPELFKKQALKILNGDEKRFQQEYECIFLDEGECAFNTKEIQRAKERISANPRNPVEIFGGVCKIFRPYKKDHIYSAGIDTAGGVGKDYHCVQVLDITNLEEIEQVAVYCENVSAVHPLASNVYELLSMYGAPPVLCEIEKNGLALLALLKNTYNYQNIVVYKSQRTEPHENDIGITPSKENKISAVDNFNYYFSYKPSLILHDIKTILELENFSLKQGEAIYGKNDDRVLALLWAIFILNTKICSNLFHIVLDEYKKPLRIINSVETTDDVDVISFHGNYSNISINIQPQRTDLYFTLG